MGGRLPVQLSRLVGREAEVDELRALLGRERLVTMTGPCGAGKSRLAIAVAGACAKEFAGGVVWVSLATLTDPARVPNAVAEAVGVADEAGVEVFDGVLAALTGARTLLVVDNCEHVVDEAAAFLERLLGECPTLTVLATSQQSLAVAGEISWATPPLAVPAEGAAARAAELREFESVRLFVERARGVQASFELTDANADVVGRICRRLDGIPLAIELAASRVNVLAIEQIDARLDSLLQVLVGGSRTALPRHRAIQATMDWSYRLLTESERRLFARLSVLSGTFGLEVVEALAGDYIEHPLDVLAALVAKSLVQARESERTRAPESMGMRYRLLRVVREYARVRLVERGESLATQAIQARFYVDLAERAETAQLQWLDLLDAEWDNLRVAHSWCEQGGWTEGALRLAAAVWQFCVVRGHYRDGRQWLESALQASGGSAAEGADDSPLRAKALVAAGRLAHLECDYGMAVLRLTDGLRSYTELADEAGMAAALEVLGSVARERGDYPEARRLHQHSLELATERADDAGIARAANYLSFAAWLDGDFAAAERHGERARRIFDGGDPEGTAWVLLNLGSAALYRDNTAEADRLLNEALAVCRASGYREGIAWSLNQLGTLAVRTGDPVRGEQVLHESLRIHQALGDRWRMTSVLDALAATALARGDALQAARLLGAATMLRADIGTPVPAVERPDRERTLTQAREALGPQRFDDALAAGSAAAPREVIREVLAAQPAGGPAPVLRLLPRGGGRMRRGQPGGPAGRPAEWTAS